MLHLEFKYCTISFSFSQWKGGQFGGYFLSSPAGERNTGWERNKMRKEAVATQSEHQEAEELTSPNFLLEFHQTSGNWLVGVGEKKNPAYWMGQRSYSLALCHVSLHHFFFHNSPFQRIWARRWTSTGLLLPFSYFRFFQLVRGFSRNTDLFSNCWPKSPLGLYPTHLPLWKDSTPLVFGKLQIDKHRPFVEVWNVKMRNSHLASPASLLSDSVWAPPLAGHLLPCSVKRGY